MPNQNSSKFADALVNGILSVSSPVEDREGVFTIPTNELKGLLANMEKPKRPPSSFILYKTENKEKFKELFPGVTRAGDLSKLVAEHYSNLSDNEKEVYENKYAILKKEYLEKMELHKQYFPSQEDQKPKKKRGRPRKVKDDNETKVPKKRGRKPKNPPKEIQRKQDSNPEIESESMRFTFNDTDSESDSDCEPTVFTEIVDSNTGIPYSVDLKSGFYYDINAPWGRSLGIYDSKTKQFN